MKTTKTRNPWKIATITILCVITALVLFYMIAMGAFSGWFTHYDPTPYGESDILDKLGNSWSQINQPIEWPVDWRQIAENSPFQLGDILAQYTVDTDYTLYRFKNLTYPTIDGSTVMVPLAMEFARQHLGFDDSRDLKPFVEFTTTPKAYGYLFNLFGDAGYNINQQPDYEDWAYDFVQSGRPLDLFIGTLFSDLELAIARRNGVTPIAKPICKDAFVFITHKDNPVESLTIEQLRGIFSGEITNWKDVGGADEAIRAFQREPGSGSQTGMEELVMKGTPMAPAEMVNIAMGMGMLIEAVAEYQNGTASIGYTYKYYIDNLYKNPDIKILRIEGVAPDEANIIRETYPLSVNYYGVIRAGDEEQPGGLFLDWILSPEGQECVKQAGYVPLGATP
ncbi:MAG: substrate-binding domain-containing protein [Oscillospiraceae bacterium]|nr:substrate-binding domain-containing protein [Oscillospiraceae bacterium]